jgi:hypothetical protein
MSCWICNKVVLNYNLLPEKDDDYKIPIINDTYELICVEPFVFLYYRICNPCLDIYLENYPFHFKKILKREIYGK